VTGNVVELDSPVTMEADQAYACRFRHLPDADAPGDAPPALSLLRSVETIPGESQVLVLSGAGDLPAPGDLALFGPEGQESREVIVTRIERGEHLTGALTLVDHAPEIEALTDAAAANIPPWDGRYGNVIDTGAVAPDAPVITRITSGASSDYDIVVALKPGPGSPAPVKLYEVRHRLVGGSLWSGPATALAATGSVTITPYAKGADVELQARAVSIADVAGPYAAAITHVVGSTDPALPAITSFAAVKRTSGMWRYTWAVEEGPDIAVASGVRIRVREGTWATFADLTALHSGTLTVSPFEIGVPDDPGTYTFGCAAVTSAGLGPATLIEVTV